jgi:tRNA-splicing ligase RtcB (3'-phosphate/5'-hydroxy nucleic acid ligase)
MPGWQDLVQQLDDYRWEIPISYKEGMRVPARIYASRRLLEMAAQEEALEQAANVAFLPGIVWRSLAMPDIHQGYGFPIGGVAAMRTDGGVVSPGGVGFDINCGTRIVLTNLNETEVRPRLRELANQLFRDIPAGLAGKGSLRLTDDDLEQVMTRGAAWAVERGYGRAADLDVTESEGCLPGADPGQVSKRARDRGRSQLGTLGSGNHFLEVQVLDEVLDREVATRFGLREPGQVLLFLHTGSRGFGHQVCQDFLDRMEAAQQRYGIELPDRQLACAPIASPEGSAYLSAMAAAANFAWANRQCITEVARRAVARIFGRSADELEMAVLYDVGHNSAKIEQHTYEGEPIELCVHRKGATRAFPAGHPEVPARYRDVGQPVLVPGDMGRCSFVAVGLETAMRETWGSACHGAGRVQSRHAAKRMLRGVNLVKRLEAQGIIVRAQNPRLLAEEASEAYKDVSEVVDVLEHAGISRNVARLRPMAVIKG